MDPSNNYNLRKAPTAGSNVNNKKSDLVGTTLYLFITTIIIFFESICILVKGVNRGILKKEVLSKESKLGFDLDIIIKP